MKKNKLPEPFVWVWNLGVHLYLSFHLQGSVFPSLNKDTLLYVLEHSKLVKNSSFTWHLIQIKILKSKFLLFHWSSVTSPFLINQSLENNFTWLRTLILLNIPVLFSVIQSLNSLVLRSKYICVFSDIPSHNHYFSIFGIITIVSCLGI